MAGFGREEVLAYHRGGKVAVSLPKPLRGKDDLCLAYTPGVAHAVRAIAERPEAVYEATAKGNLVPSSPTAPPSSASATSVPPPPSR